MASLKAVEFQRFEHILRNLRETLRAVVRAELKASRHRGLVKLAGEVHDAGDESVAELLIGVELSGRERELEELRDVEQALERIKQGNFGVCVDCGHALGRGRLEVYPSAKRCVACQQRRERGRRGGKDATPSL